MKNGLKGQIVGLAVLLLVLGCGRKDTMEQSKAMLSGVVKGDVVQVRTLLDEGANIEAKNSSERTALMLAALAGNKEMLDLLILKGANLKATDGSGMTPLLWAAFGGNPRVVEQLIQKGADVKERDKNGRSALEWAREHPAAIEVLKRAGAKQ